MPCSRFFTVLAGMVRGINMSPEVVPISGVGWPCAGIFVRHDPFPSMETGFPPTPFTLLDQAWKLWSSLAFFMMTHLARCLLQMRCCWYQQWSRNILDEEKVQVTHYQLRSQCSSNLHWRVMWFEKSRSAVAIVDGRYPSRTIEWEHSWSQVARQYLGIDKIKSKPKITQHGVL